MANGLGDALRRHGVLAGISYAVCRSLQRLMILDVTHVMIQDTRALVSADHDDGIEYRFLREADILQFSEDPLADISVDMAARLESDHDLCFAGIIDGKLACYSWFALHSIEAEHNRSSESPLSGMAISFPNHFAFRYKGYTHPEFRGQRLYQRVAVEAAMGLRAMGIDSILSTAEIVNFSALKSSYRSGFQFLGHLAVAVIAGKRFTYYPDLSQHGIRFDKDADVGERDENRRPAESPVGDTERHRCMADATA